MLLLQHEAGGQNWSTSFEDISEKNGLGIIWLCQGVGFEARFIADFKDRLFFLLQTKLAFRDRE